MRDHVRYLATRAKAVRVTDFHQTPLAGEVEGRDYDRAGIISDDWLAANTPVADADYYICGPRPFLRHAVSTLSLAGVPSYRIHYEFFGPAAEPLAAGRTTQGTTAATDAPISYRSSPNGRPSLPCDRGTAVH